MFLSNDQIPNLFVVGAPKCGTSSMHDFFAMQDSIHMSRYKEPHFFATDIEAPQFVKRPNAYSDLFANSEGCKYRGESSPLYLYSSEAIRKILQFNPTSKIVICLRNPVDACVSMHNGLYANGKEPISEFKSSFEIQWQRKLGVFEGKTGWPRAAFDYVGLFRYAPQIKNALQHVPRKQVFFILFDDLPNAQNKIIPELELFLSMTLCGDIPKSNIAKSVHSKLVQKMLVQMPYGCRQVLGHIVPKSLKSKIQSANRAEKKTESTALDPKFLTYVSEFFSGDIDDTSELIGRDLSHWKNRLT